MLAAFKIYSDGAAAPPGFVKISYQGPAWVCFDKAQIFLLLQAAGQKSIPPGLYTTQDSPRNTGFGPKNDRGWAPAKDDSNVNPGTGAAKANDHSPSTSAVLNPVGGVVLSLIQYLQVIADQCYRIGQVELWRRLTVDLVQLRLKEPLTYPLPELLASAEKVLGL